MHTSRTKPYRLFLPFLLIGLFLLSSCSDQSKDTLDSEFQLAPNSSYQEFDDQGLLIKKTDVHANGETSTFEYEYNEQGLLTLESGNSSKGDTYTIDNTYNIKGLITHSTYTTASQTTSSHLTYNEEDQLILKSSIQTLDDGTVLSSNHRYNDLGQLVSVTTTNSNNHISTSQYTYNTEGLLILETNTSTTQGSFSNQYSYDDNGNRVKTIFTDSQRMITTLLEYNTSNPAQLYKQTTTVQDLENNIIETTIDVFAYTLSGSRKQVTTTRIDADHNVTIKVYEYDSQGITSITTTASDGTVTSESI